MNVLTLVLLSDADHTTSQTTSCIARFETFFISTLAQVILLFMNLKQDKHLTWQKKNLFRHCLKVTTVPQWIKAPQYKPGDLGSNPTQGAFWILPYFSFPTSFLSVFTKSYLVPGYSEALLVQPLVSWSPNWLHNTVYTTIFLETHTHSCANINPPVHKGQKSYIYSGNNYTSPASLFKTYPM